MIATSLTLPLFVFIKYASLQLLQIKKKKLEKSMPSAPFDSKQPVRETVHAAFLLSLKMTLQRSVSGRVSSEDLER